MQPEEADHLRQRTKQIAIRIVRLYRALPPGAEGRVIGRQLLRSGTSIGANYRAACRSRSEAEFVARLAVALEEADESLYWLELLIDTRTVPAKRLTALIAECEELVRIFSAARHTTQQRIRIQNSKFKIQNS